MTAEYRGSQKRAILTFCFVVELEKKNNIMYSTAVTIPIIIKDLAGSDCRRNESGPETPNYSTSESVVIDKVDCRQRQTNKIT